MMSDDVATVYITLLNYTGHPCVTVQYHVQAMAAAMSAIPTHVHLLEMQNSWDSLPAPIQKAKRKPPFENRNSYVHQHIASWSAAAVLIAEEFAWEFYWAPISQDVLPVQLLPFDLKLQCPVHPLIPLAALAHPGKRLCLSYEAPSSTAADQTVILRI